MDSHLLSHGYLVVVVVVGCCCLVDTVFQPITQSSFDMTSVPSAILVSLALSSNLSISSSSMRFE